MKHNLWIPVVIAIGAASVMMRPVAGQDAGGPPMNEPGGGPAGPGGPGGQMPNFEEMRQRMDQRTMEQLGVTEEEWAVIKPKVDRVRNLQWASMAGRGPMGFGGPGGPGGPGRTDQAANPVAQAVRDLQETLANKDATSDQVKSKLAALREAKTKAQQELKAAQDELKELVTARQEATLVVMGVLE